MTRVAAAPPPGFVLDCSVTMAWFFADERSGYGEAVLRHLPTASAVVPALWHLEVANTFVQAERRDRSTPAQASRFTEFLARLPVLVDGETLPRAWADTLNLARLHGLSAYDAAYLELALRRGLPLAAFDGRLMDAAAAAGVPALGPA